MVAVLWAYGAAINALVTAEHKGRRGLSHQGNPKKHCQLGCLVRQCPHKTGPDPPECLVGQK